MNSIHIFPLPHSESGATVKRACLIKRLDGSTMVSDEELWFEIDRIDEKLPDDDCESYLLAMLLEAMAENRHVVVHGGVSRELLSNLTEFRDAWVSWRPTKYHRIKIDAEVEIKPGTRAPGAICAFSGGLDASFSVWRNTENRNGARTQELSFCVMVHGADIPLKDDEAFSNAFSLAAKTLASLNLTLRRVRTNFRELSKVNWEDSHGAFLVAALANYRGLAGVGILASGQAYCGILRPWGSSPITDHLLAGANFAVVHDGASHTRTQKAFAVSDWREGFDNLRVCWEGEAKDKNCGKCEKCLRTMLNISANGLAIPPCFPKSSIDLAELRKIALKGDVQLGNWREIVDTARRNGIEDAWVEEVERKLKPAWIKVQFEKVNLRRLKDVLFPDNTLRKRMAKRLYLFLKGRG